MSDEPKKFLAIKNWRKYQTIDDEKGRAPYVKDYVDKDADPDRMKLTGFRTNVLDRLYRLRARYGRTLINDISWLIDATYTHRTDRPHFKDAIGALIERKFIIPTDDENFETSAAVEVRKGRGKGKKDVDVEEEGEAHTPQRASQKKETPTPVWLQGACKACQRYGGPIPGHEKGCFEEEASA